MVARSCSELNHPNILLPMIRRDEDDIQSLLALMETSWMPPLSPDQAQFVSFLTATVAPPEVDNDPRNAHKMGEDAYQDFKKSRPDKSTDYTVP